MEAIKKSKPSSTHSNKSDGKTPFLGIQAKLNVNKPGDKYEVEADHAAEQVVSKQSTPTPAFVPSTSPVQLKQENDEPVVQEKPIVSSITPFVQAKEEEPAQMMEEEPAQAKEEEVQAKEEEVQTKEEEPAQMKEEEPAQAKEEEVQAKEEEVQAKEEEPAQMKEEEPVQAKEEEVQAKEEEVQAKEEEPAQMKEEEPAQAKEEDVQAKEEEVQAKEEEPAQMMEEEPAQAKEEEVQAKEEEVQAKEEEPVQAKEEELQAKEDEQVQAKLQPSAPTAPSKPSINDQLSSSKGAGSSLSGGVKQEMESGFGADFSGVKIHTDDRAASMSKEIGAQAFTNKGDIYFNQGKFNPATTQGITLLAHELTHTIQQGAAGEKKDQPKAGKDETTATPTTDKKATGDKTQIVESKTGDPSTTGASTDKATDKPVDAATGSASSTTTNPSVPTATATKPAEVAPIEGTPLTADALAAEGDLPVEGEEVVAEEPSIERDPTANPAFQEVVSAIGTKAGEQTEHDPAEELSAEAQDAAVSPANERTSMAQAGQVDEMEAQEPQEFNAANFKAMLMSRIAEMQLPKNNDEADKFDKNNNIDEVNKKAVGDVNKEKDAAAGPIEQSKDKAPNVAGTPERKVATLVPPKPGAKPGSVGAAKAIPDTRPESEVSKPLKDDAAEMDTKMAENNVTDHQLEISQEPKFQQGLESKNTAKANTESAPVELRTKEQETLQKNASKAEGSSKAELAGMNALSKGAVGDVLGKQKTTGSKDTSERERIAGEINKIYETTKTDVTGILDDLETKVTQVFEYGSNVAKKKFEDYVAHKMALYKLERYSGGAGALKWGYDLFAGLPDEVNVFFTEGREVFVKVMDEFITKIAEYVAHELNRAKQRIEKGKQEVTDYVDSLPKNLKKFGKEAADEIQEKFADLQNDVNSKQEALVDTLAQEYVASLQEVDARIEEMKAANKGLIDAAMGFINGIIDTINKLIELINSLLAAISSVINIIMADPIGFMELLFDGIAQGIDLFKANIQKHLLGGLLQWLTGSLGPMGITVPDDIFSLSGIFNLVLQVLGIGWDMLRMKSVKMMGEPAVNALETGADAGFTVFQSVKTQGIMGLWDFLKEKFSDLKEMVIDAIKDMLITQVIEAGIKWLLSLLIPGAGFIKAIMAIKDVIVFFVESAIMLIPALIEAILALAAGSVAGVAKAIEFGLARLIPLVIGLLANLIGLGGLSKKVMKIFKKIRKRVDKAVNKLLAKAKKAARKILRKLGIGKKGNKKKKGDKDSRSDKEMKSDLNKGIQEATTFIKSGEKDNKKIRKQLDKIEGKYDLVELKLVIDKQNPDGKDKGHIHGSVNPEDDGPVINLDEGQSEFPERTVNQDGQTVVISVNEATEHVIVSNNTEGIKDFLKTLKNDYPTFKEKIEELEKVIESKADPIVRKILNEPENKNKLLEQLIIEMTEISKMVKSILGEKALALSDAKEKYKLEGLTGTFGTIPKPKFDDFTGDHMPQAALFIALSKRPEFVDNTEMQNRSKGEHADGAYVINLQSKRHAAGRTYGRSSLKDAFLTKYVADSVKIDLNPSITDKLKAKRELAVEMLIEELNLDVNAMTSVYNRTSADVIWNDLENHVNGDDKEKLIDDIKNRVNSGLSQISNQPMNNLKK